MGQAPAEAATRHRYLQLPYLLLGSHQFQLRAREGTIQAPLLHRQPHRVLVSLQLLTLHLAIPPHLSCCTKAPPRDSHNQQERI